MTATTNQLNPPSGPDHTTGPDAGYLILDGKGTVSIDDMLAQHTAMNFVLDPSADIDRIHRLEVLPRKVTRCLLVQAFGQPLPHGTGWIFRADDGRVFNVYNHGGYRIGGHSGRYDDFKTWLLDRLRVLDLDADGEDKPQGSG